MSHVFDWILCLLSGLDVLHHLQMKIWKIVKGLKNFQEALYVEPGQYLDGRPPGKTRLLLEEVLVRPAVGAHPVVCAGPNAPV